MVGNILGGCLFESVLTIWCISLLEDTRAILPMYDLHLAVCTCFEKLCIACLYKSMKIVNFVFLHFFPACRLSLFVIKLHLLLTHTMEKSCDLQLSAKNGVHDYLIQCAKSHSTGSPFQQMKTLIQQ